MKTKKKITKLIEVASSFNSNNMPSPINKKSAEEIVKKIFAVK